VRLQQRHAYLWRRPWIPPRRRSTSDVADFVLQTDISYSDSLTISHPGIPLSTAISYADTFSMGGGIPLSTNIVWSDALTAGGDIGVDLSTAITWSDSFDMGANMALSTTITWSDALGMDAPTMALSTTITWSDTLGIGGAIAMPLSTTIVWTDQLSVNDNTASAVLLNTYAINALSGAASEYSYGFDSYAQLNGVHYAIDDNGVYTLGGSDDNGTDISATLRTGLNDFGAEKQKRMDSARFGLISDGNVIVKARVEQSGVLNEHWYQSGNTIATAPRERVVKFGKGLRSAYWQFEINNEAGADFEFDRIDYYPVPQERRR